MKNKPLTSIVMVAYDLTQLSRQITALALEAICKYTDEEDYELILMDTIPQGCGHLRLSDAFDVFQLGREDRQWIKQDLEKMENPGQYGSYNRGAELAKGDYLCFIQNDVIVTEGWLSALKYYLDKGLSDSVQPSQFPKTREFMKKSYTMSYEDGEMMKGARDAGLIMMTRAAFNKIKGWNSDMRIFWGESDIYNRLASNGLLNICTNKTQILHVNSATYYARKDIEPQKQADDVTLSNDVKNKGTITT